MQKLYENFKIFHFQKKIVSVESIHGDKVTNFDPAKKKLNNKSDTKGQEFLSFIASGTSSVTSF